MVSVRLRLISIIYLIGANSYVKNYLDLQEKYYESGERLTVFTTLIGTNIAKYDE